MGILTLSAMAAAALSHGVALEHRGDMFDVEYVALVETGSKTIGVSPPTRRTAGSQRCRTTIEVAIERRISPRTTEKAMTSVLPDRETYTETRPGRCRGSAAERTMLAAKSDVIARHLAQSATRDRTAAIAAIESVRHLAAN